MRSFLKLTKEAAFILIIASIISVFLNINLIRKYAEYDFKGDFLFLEGDTLPELITVYEAEELWQRGEAIFIDSRSQEEFKKGHILGAINVPLNSINSLQDLKNMDIPQERIIIAYCGGGDCKSSFYLAYFLQKAGFRNVKVLEGGWPKWFENGLPWEKD